jgi:arginyl-tRNA synthetase
MDYTEVISGAIAEATGKKKEDVRKLIEMPPDRKMGDYAFPCFALAKEMRKNPKDIAHDISSKIKLPAGIQEMKTVGAYLNFFADEGTLAEGILKEVIEKGGDYGKNSSLAKKKIMVEYSAPNTNKPLHVGHLRNDSTGMAVCRILAANGAEVIKANLFSDRGVHICKSMLAYSRFGRGSTPEKESLKPDHFVGKYYVRFAEEAKKEPSLEKEALGMLAKWEAGDKKTRALWKKMDKWATSGFMQTYREFGSEFDVIFRESEYYDKAKEVIGKGTKQGVFEETDTGLMAKLEKHGLPDKTVLRKDGTSIYVTNDLALTKHKFMDFGLDESIWVVGSEQKLYFRQLFKIFELLGFKWAKNCRHLSYEMIYLPEGRLKSREGKVVDADELIEKAKEACMKELSERYPELGKKEKEERARLIALAAIKFFMLKTDPNKSMLFEGLNTDLSLLQSTEEKELVKLTGRFSSLCSEAGRKLAPDLICHYLLELSAAFNNFYHSHNVLNTTPEEREARLVLVQAAAQTIKNGLALLNIGVVEEM